MHAMIEYHAITGDQRVRDAIVKMADHALTLAPRSGAGGMYRKAVAFAAREAAAGAPYRAALAEVLASRGYRYLFQIVSGNPVHWTGDTAFINGNVPGGLFWINDIAYMLSVLAAEPVLNQAQEGDIRRLDERVVVHRVRFPRESWQSEYDNRPDLAEYLREKGRRSGE